MNISELITIKKKKGLQFLIFAVMHCISFLRIKQSGAGNCCPCCFNFVLICFRFPPLCLLKNTKVQKKVFKSSLLFFFLSFLLFIDPGNFGRDPGDTEHHRDQPTSAHRTGGLPQPAHGEQDKKTYKLRHCSWRVAQCLIKNEPWD